VRIGVIGPIDPDLFADNICDSLFRMGHTAVPLGSARGFVRGSVLPRLAYLAREHSAAFDDRLQRSVLNRAVAADCDIILNTEGNLAPDIVAELDRRGVPVALWFPDSVLSFGRSRMLAAPYRALFFKDPAVVTRLRDSLGIPAWYLPEACNPHWHRPVAEGRRQPHVAVVGNMHVARIMLVRRLHDAGIPIVLYGAPIASWARELLPPELSVRPPVFREQKSYVFGSAVAVLNNVHLSEMAGVNCRLFEATAAAGAVLCERRAALDTLFDIDREVLAYRSFAELLDQARTLLNSPQLAVDLGEAATKRAHAEHAYEQRLQQIIELVA
jgi:spore maturation protein CgeB